MYDAVEEGMTRGRSVVRVIGASVVLGAGLLMTASCGGGKFSTGCAADIDSCADDEVCWPTTEGFACLKAPTSGGTNGAQCTNTIDRPSCAHGFVCYPVDSSATPPVLQCSPRCDPPDTTPCPNTAGICQVLRIGDIGEIGVCQP